MDFRNHRGDLGMIPKSPADTEAPRIRERVELRELLRLTRKHFPESLIEMLVEDGLRNHPDLLEVEK